MVGEMPSAVAAGANPPRSVARTKAVMLAMWSIIKQYFGVTEVLDSLTNQIVERDYSLTRLENTG